MILPDILKTISKTLNRHYAKAVVVGGSVRDHFLGLPIKDYDIEVYGLQTLEELEEILSVFGSVNHVGKSFGILKFIYGADEYDFSFPRIEQKIGKGHRGFEVFLDGKMDFKEAARRRDFTINAMGYDIETQIFMDPFNAKEDIKNGILRHVDDDSFAEDPLRVYRAVQFSARFGFSLFTDTYKLCKKMTDDGLLMELPIERVYAEFVKLFLKSSRPSIGFELMYALGILQYFPELEAIINVPQNQKWHPEGDVWVHTMMCIDAMVPLLGNNEKQNLKYMFAILCHDFGKATTTTIGTDGRIRAIGHELEGVTLTQSFMYRLTSEHDFIKSILPLVEHHLKPSQFYAVKSSPKTIRKLATKVNIEELVIIAKADFLGRTTEESLQGVYRAGEWLLEKARDLKVENKPLDNLLRGRDLLDMGLVPSPLFQNILDGVYTLQLEGTVNTKEEALKYVKKRYML